jgi:hypothetical protein
VLLELGPFVLADGDPASGTIPARVLALTETDAVGVPANLGRATVVHGADAMLVALEGWKQDAGRERARRMAQFSAIRFDREDP